MSGFSEYSLKPLGIGLVLGTAQRDNSERGRDRASAVVCELQRNAEVVVAQQLHGGLKLILAA